MANNQPPFPANTWPWVPSSRPVGPEGGDPGGTSLGNIIFAPTIGIANRGSHQDGGGGGEACYRHGFHPVQVGMSGGGSGGGGGGGGFPSYANPGAARPTHFVPNTDPEFLPPPPPAGLGLGLGDGGTATAQARPPAYPYPRTDAHVPCPPTAHQRHHQPPRHEADGGEEDAELAAVLAGFGAWHRVAAAAAVEAAPAPSSAQLHEVRDVLRRGLAAGGGLFGLDAAGVADLVAAWNTMVQWALHIRWEANDRAVWADLLLGD